MGEALTLNEFTIMEIMGKGEEVKAKNEKHWVCAPAREGKQAEQVVLSNSKCNKSFVFS